MISSCLIKIVSTVYTTDVVWITVWVNVKKIAFWTVINEKNINFLHIFFDRYVLPIRIVSEFRFSYFTSMIRWRANLPRPAAGSHHDVHAGSILFWSSTTTDSVAISAHTGMVIYTEPQWPKITDPLSHLLGY